MVRARHVESNWRKALLGRIQTGDRFHLQLKVKPLGVSDRSALIFAVTDTVKVSASDEGLSDRGLRQNMVMCAPAVYLRSGSTGLSVRLDRPYMENTGNALDVDELPLGYETRVDIRFAGDPPYLAIWLNRSMSFVHRKQFEIYYPGRPHMQASCGPPKDSDDNIGNIKYVAADAIVSQVAYRILPADATLGDWGLDAADFDGGEGDFACIFCRNCLCA